MTSNIRFRYLYRDAGNFKVWNEIIFANPDGLTPKECEARIRPVLFDREFFIAHQVQLPALFLQIDGRLIDADHCLHEYADLEETSDNPTDAANRTITRLLQSFESVGQSNWQCFDVRDL